MQIRNCQKIKLAFQRHIAHETIFYNSDTTDAIITQNCQKFKLSFPEGSEKSELPRSRSKKSDQKNLHKKLKHTQAKLKKKHALPSQSLLHEEVLTNKPVPKSHQIPCCKTDCKKWNVFKRFSPSMATNPYPKLYYKAKLHRE